MSRTAYDLAQTIVRTPTHELSQLGAPLPYPAPRRSPVGSILRFLGWTFLIALGLFAAVTVASVWMVSDAARDIFSLDTRTTIITGDAVVESIKRVNKQVFIEHYNTVDIDYSEAPEGWLGHLPIQQSFVLLLKGSVPAGFDLSQLTPKDVWISSDGSRVQLVLPPPVIFAENVNVDFEHSRVLTQQDTCPEFICETTLEAFKSHMLPQGRQVLIEASERSGILAQAATDGQRYYEQLLKSLGFAEVQVIIRGVDQ
jgi:hypothetical protein